MNTDLSKKQIRNKLYYLKKTNQINKYKRYMKKYRDYDSDDDEPIQINNNKEILNNDDELLNDNETLNDDKKYLQTISKSQYNTLEQLFRNIKSAKTIFDLYKILKEPKIKSTNQMETINKNAKKNKNEIHILNPLGF